MKFIKEAIVILAATVLTLGCVQQGSVNRQELAVIECKAERDVSTKAALNEVYDNKGNRTISDSMRVSKEEALKTCLANKGF